MTRPACCQDGPSKRILVLGSVPTRLHTVTEALGVHPAACADARRVASELEAASVVILTEPALRRDILDELTAAAYPARPGAIPVLALLSRLELRRRMPVTALERLHPIALGAKPNPETLRGALVLALSLSAANQRARGEAGEESAHNLLAYRSSNNAAPADMRPLRTDVAQRVDQLVDRLRQAQLEHRRLMTVLDALPVGVYLADEAGRIRHVNRAGRAIWEGRIPGSSPGDYETDFKAWWCDTGQRVQSDEWALARALRNGHTAAEEELEIETFAGTRKTILNYALPIFSEARTIVGAVAVNVDITARKQAEQDRAQLTAVLSSSNDAIIAKSMSGDITEWNVGAERLYGYTADEAIGQSIELIIPPERAGESETILARLRRGEDVRELETERVRKDGRRLTISLTVTPAKDPRGNIVKVIAVARDITERKRLEQKLAYEACHDKLTGAANRELFFDRLDHLIKQGQRQRVSYSVLVLDIDEFKAVNDGFGHLVGDRLLIEAAQRMAQCLRPGDTLARFGGDEFVVLLENAADEVAASQVAARIQQAMAQPFQIDEVTVCSGVSVGMAFSSGGYQSTHDIVRAADNTLYEVKRRRKGSSGNPRAAQAGDR